MAHKPVHRKRNSKKEKNPSTIKGIVKISLVFVIVNIAYLIVLPLLTAQIVPCLTNHPFVSYTNTECTVERALDQFMVLALIGLSVLTITFLGVLKRYLKIAPFHDMKTWTKIPSKKQFLLEFVPLIITTLVMAASIVVFYFLFIQTAETAVRNAPIILDSVTKPLTK